MKEHAWLVQRLTDHPGSPDAASHNIEDKREDIECGCCFSSYSFVSISGSQFSSA
jgi:hypothetical protein